LERNSALCVTLSVLCGLKNLKKHCPNNPGQCQYHHDSEEVTASGERRISAVSKLDAVIYTFEISFIHIFFLWKSHLDSKILGVFSPSFDSPLKIYLLKR
tara:strand:- start:1861 stop:2160 length:300 start_codon:yes stop_codon:yes gene_type:complete